MSLQIIIAKLMLDGRCLHFRALVVLFFSSGLVDGKTITLDIPMTAIVGDFTFAREEISNSVADYGNIYLRNPGTGDNVFLGPTRNQTYRASVIPCEYESTMKPSHLSLYRRMKICGSVAS